MAHRFDSQLKEIVLDDSLAQLQTGDIVLFRGSRAISDLICFMTNSRWSHIGIVIRPQGSAPLLFEATTITETPDVQTGKPIMRGITLVPLKQRIKQYPGRVAARRLEGVKRTERFEQLTSNWVEQWQHQPYKRYTLAILIGLLPKPWQIHLPGLFCSELVAEYYKKLNCLEAKKSSCFFVPGDFEHCAQLELSQGWLSTEYFLK